MKKRLRSLAVACGVLLALTCACLLGYRHFARLLQSQSAAERWQGESEDAYAQFSCFLTETGTVSLNEIYTFRAALQQKLVEASLSASPGGSLWRDAWSCFGSVAVAGDRGGATASVTAVGGDFFFFHPLTLLSGTYLSESDLMGDRVLLDRELAWRLFGGTDLAGMTVTIRDKPFVVAGVVERESDFASERAYTGGAGLYMSFAAYSELAEAGIGCYEIVLPQPVDGFAEGLLSGSFPIGGGEIVNNSARFSLSSSWSILRHFGERSMHTTSVVYPYWENAARVVGDWCALLLALAIAFALLPAVTAFVLLLVSLVFAKDFLGEKIPEWGRAGRERLRKKRSSRRGAHSKRK